MLTPLDTVSWLFNGSPCKSRETAFKPEPPGDPSRNPGAQDDSWLGTTLIHCFQSFLRVLRVHPFFVQPTDILSS